MSPEAVAVSHTTLPPKPPPVTTATTDDRTPSPRLRFRLQQVVVCTLVLLVTGWCFTIHAAVGLTATFLAKHVIVAVLAMGLGIDDEPAKRLR